MHELAFAFLIGACLFVQTRTSLAVAVGNAFAWALDSLGVPFDLWIWVGIDLAMLAFIVRKQMSIADTLITLLFLPSWVAYFLPQDALFWGPWWFSLTQLILCLLPWLQRGIFDVSHGPLRELNYAKGG